MISKIKLIPFLCLQIFMITDFCHASENYSPEVVLHAKWGHSDYSIGYEAGQRREDGFLEPGTGPSCFTVDSKEKIYILDTINLRVSIFSIDGKLQQQFSLLNVEIDTRKYSFRQPKNIAVDKLGNIYVTDLEYKSVIFKFLPSGKLGKVINNFGPYPASQVWGLYLEETLDGNIMVNFGISGSRKSIRSYFDPNWVLLGENLGFVDGKGRRFKVSNETNDMIGKGPLPQDFKIDISDSNKLSHITISLLEYPFFPWPAFKGVDSKGNIFLYNNKNKALLKFSDGGDLITEIKIFDELKKYGNPVSATQISRWLNLRPNGDIYTMQCYEDGFRIIKFGIIEGN